MVHATCKSVALSDSATFVLTAVVVVSGFVLQKVHRPSNQLTAKQYQRGHQRCLLGQLSQFVDLSANPARIDLTCFGKKYHVPFHVACAFVMLTVGDFPGKVGDQQCGMQNPARGIVQGFRG